MKKVKKKQMTEEEYRYIASLLGDKNFLVFGTGHDSELWRYSNKNGFTVFLENNDEWIDEHNDIYKVTYNTRLDQADFLLSEFKNGNTSNLEIRLPDFVTETQWDVILVDSPEGWAKHCPGRMQSLYAAYVLAKEHTHILVHDCDRYVEDLYTSEFFTNRINNFTKLRHFKK